MDTWGSMAAGFTLVTGITSSIIDRKEAQLGQEGGNGNCFHAAVTHLFKYSGRCTFRDWKTPSLLEMEVEMSKKGLKRKGLEMPLVTNRIAAKTSASAGEGR